MERREEEETHLNALVINRINTVQSQPQSNEYQHRTAAPPRPFPTIPISIPSYFS